MRILVRSLQALAQFGALELEEGPCQPLAVELPLAGSGLGLCTWSMLERVKLQLLELLLLLRVGLVWLQCVTELHRGQWMWEQWVLLRPHGSFPNHRRRLFALHSSLHRQ